MTTDEITQLLTGPIAEAMGWGYGIFEEEGGYVYSNANGKTYYTEKGRPAIVCELLMPELFDQGWTMLVRIGRVTIWDPRQKSEIKVTYVGEASDFHNAFIIAYAKQLQGGE